jgi:hypothetical protein
MSRTGGRGNAGPRSDTSTTAIVRIPRPVIPSLLPCKESFGASYGPERNTVGAFVQRSTIVLWSASAADGMKRKRDIDESPYLPPPLPFAVSPFAFSLHASILTSSHHGLYSVTTAPDIVVLRVYSSQVFWLIDNGIGLNSPPFTPQRFRVRFPSSFVWIDRGGLPSWTAVVMPSSGHIQNSYIGLSTGHQSHYLQVDVSGRFRSVTRVSPVPLFFWCTSPRITHAPGVSETPVGLFRRYELYPMVVQDHIKAAFSGPELNEI